MAKFVRASLLILDRPLAGKFPILNKAFLILYHFFEILTILKPLQLFSVNNSKQETFTPKTKQITRYRGHLRAPACSMTNWF